MISLGKLKQNTLRTFFLNKLLQIGELIWKLDLNKYTKQLFTKFSRNCKDSIVGKPLWISLTVLLPGACLESLMKFPIDLMMLLKVWPIIYLNDIQGCRNRRTRRCSSPPLTAIVSNKIVLYKKEEQSRFYSSRAHSYCSFASLNWFRKGRVQHAFFRGTLMHTWKSANIFVFIWK